MKHLQLFEKKVIERTEGVPYLIRWNLLGIGEDSKYFSIKLHKILASDSNNLHNHPWKFVSIILKGSYLETTKWYYQGDYTGWSPSVWSECNKCYVTSKIFSSGSILKRPAYWAHSLVITKPVWTLVFTFKKVQTWGFFTKEGFINWKDYSKNNEC